MYFSFTQTLFGSNPEVGWKVENRQARPTHWCRHLNWWWNVWHPILKLRDHRASKTSNVVGIFSCVHFNSQPWAISEFPQCLLVIHQQHSCYQEKDEIIKWHPSRQWLTTYFRMENETERSGGAFEICRWRKFVSSRRGLILVEDNQTRLSGLE